MNQLCGTSDCAFVHSSSLTTSLSMPSPDSVHQTATTAEPDDPLNVMGQLGGAVISLMIVIGVVGNVLVLTVIVQCPQLRRSYNAFIASLSVTDLILNLTVMPFYIDSYLYRRWRFSDAVCRWHTFFGTVVIVSSSLHIALIATSRYHVIVRPRFYARWLSSGVAVVSQIVFAWVAAAACILPGAVGLLPVVIGYSDQLSRCNYDRAKSHGALTVIFCGGFIVPCVVMGYCYAMIWRRTREVGLRIDGYSACRLQEQRQRQQNGESVSLTAAALNACVSSRETARTEPRDDRPRTTAAGEKVDVHKSTTERSSNGNIRTVGVMDCPQGTAADCHESLLPEVGCETVITVAVDRPHEHISDDVAQQDGPTAVHSTAQSNITSCPVANDDDEDDVDNYQCCENQQPTNPSGYHLLMPSSPPASCFSEQPTSSSGPLMSTRTIEDAEEQETGASEGRVKNKDNEQLVADKDLEHLAAERRTRSRECITVVITPATTPCPAVSALRESPAGVISSYVTANNRRRARDHVQRWTTRDDACLPVARDAITRHKTTKKASMLTPVLRRWASCEVGRTPPAASTHSCHRHRSQSLRMILAVFFAFVLTYLPYTVTNLADQNATLDRNVYMMTSLAFWAGSCVNPLIYGIMNSQFRRAYASIVVNCWRHSVARCRR